MSGLRVRVGVRGLGLGVEWVGWCLPGPSNVVPYWVWYGFLVRAFIRTTKKVLHWRV